MTFTWQAGRRTKTVTTSKEKLIFDYDKDGIRLRKTVQNKSTGASVVHTYDYQGVRYNHIPPETRSRMINGIFDLRGWGLLTQ